MFLCGMPISLHMGVSGVSSSSGYRSPEAIEAERTMLVVKKQQDVAKDQGQALVDLVKKSSDGVGGNINVYA